MYVNHFSSRAISNVVFLNLDVSKSFWGASAQSDFDSSLIVDVKAGGACERRRVFAGSGRGLSGCAMEVEYRENFVNVTLLTN
ncbi:hypothetical protein SARC_08076 [Sphaeroforma arctica JP610]|uniref:Uncharacterized protein n=1 Tax=Sphaeroforma arctica JP610 TaxID=667725 RepID=A0A0L0FRT4_9EUKA|nr:hypothetical protein SARC_08076 [Sphaeroforma arctica JP610]KNC79532.1 hypothetical protein SARC_08076 [Sphaeroforma arctica JP610]|eukprot:XP_014153434.1 hypothetical protein SARC_08076 [Sphaeroforma arctica JP610]